MASADLHIMNSCPTPPKGNLNEAPGIHVEMDAADAALSSADSDVPLSLMRHCSELPDGAKLANGDSSHQDAVDYSSSGNSGQHSSSRETDDEVQVFPKNTHNQNVHVDGSDKILKPSQPTFQVVVKEERDGDSPCAEDDARQGLSAFCEALYSAGGPPQGFVVNPANMGNLPPDAKPVLALMSAASNQQTVKKRRRRRKLRNGELAPGEEHFPYRCDVCEKGLRSLAALKYHERIHSGETPFECQYCGRRFAVTSHLNYHVRVHTGEKPYECSICGRRFAVSNHLRYHERAHTGEKPFRCSVCDKGFTSNFNLKYHEQIHAGIKPHACDFCGKKYRSKAGLTGHQMKKGHHDRFQSMARDGYFLDGRGPSFSAEPSSANQDMKEEAADGSRFSPALGSQGESRGESSIQSTSADAPKPKRKGPGRPPTLFNRARQLEMQLLQPQQAAAAPLVQNGNPDPARPVQPSPQDDSQRAVQPPVQQQPEEEHEDNEHDSGEPSPDFRPMQQPTPAASPPVQHPVQHLQLQLPQAHQMQQSQSPSVYPPMMNVNSHQIPNGASHSTNQNSSMMGNAMSMFAAHAQQQSGSFMTMPSGAADPRYGAFMAAPGHHGSSVGGGMGMGMSMVGQIDHQQRFLAGMRSPHLQLHPGHQPMHHQPWEFDDFRNRTGINYASKKL